MEHSHVASDTPQSYGAIPENEVYVEDVHLIEGGLHDRADDDSDHHNLFTGGGRSRSNSLAESAASSVRDVLLSGFHYEGSVCSIREFGGDASIPNEIINMVKNLIGAGVLSLSGGMADFSNSPLGACITASVWIVLLGIIFGYSCLLIGKVCQITKSSTYRECWEETMGSKGALAISWSNALKAAMANLAYSTILSQTFSSLSETVGFPISRIQALFLITIVALLPLCLLKNLSVLAPFSALGTLGIVLTAASMIIRFVDGSYQEGGQYFDDIPEHWRPYFGTDNRPFSPATLPFVCMLFEAYIMHYNSPRFYVELENATIPRFQRVCEISFGFSAICYMAIASVGFLTFGGNCDGYILNNYSPHDPFATVCRLCIALSTLLTFPIVFMGFRDGILDVMEFPTERQTVTNINLLTVILLTIITLTATVVTDLGMINAIGGGTLATAIVFVFPALMYRQAVKQLGTQAKPGQHTEVVIDMALMGFGITLGVTGVIVSIKALSS